MLASCPIPEKNTIYKVCDETDQANKKSGMFFLRREGGFHLK